jgi:hypothetical protein
METVKKSPAKLVRERTPGEIKMMKIINISVLSLVGAMLVGIVLCVINDKPEIACALGFCAAVMLWNYRIIRRKYARGL